jgi:imidazolonepropionase-like amidohydrolase
LVTAGQFLAPAGRYFPGLSRAVSAAELPDAAEEEARASGQWVKVIGDFPDGDGSIRANYPAAVLASAVARAHAAGARVAVHVMSVAGVDAAVEAGVDSIEHGEGMTADHIAVMVERGIAFVPTMTILPLLEGLVGSMGLGPAQLATTLGDIRGHADIVGAAAGAGVQILAGTDAGMVPHGIVVDEVRNLARAGLAGGDALAAASWNARRFLGLPSIEEGAPADVVAFAGDPRTDVDQLDRPVVRILDGRLVGPPATPS